MPRRLTNLLLLGLVLGLAGSGWLGWVLPAARAGPFYDLHRLCGAALLLVLGWKYGIARLSLQRRLGRPRWDRSALIGVAAGLALASCLGFGLAWTLDLVSFGSLWGYSALNLHVQLGLALLPLFLWHTRRRWERRPALPELVARRAALRLIGLGAASLAAWQAVERVATARASTSGRLASGSKHAGSYSANAYPETIWLLDAVPRLDAATWRLEVTGRVERPLTLSMADLAALPPDELEATLDCTGGWWSAQRWQGVRLGELLELAGARREASAALVVSVTGHRWSFPLEELRGMLLASRVGGEPLTPGHGAPARLVASGRRGLQWVKWVARIEVR